jgi:hypothetical protein
MQELGCELGSLDSDGFMDGALDVDGAGVVALALLAAFESEEKFEAAMLLTTATEFLFLKAKIVPALRTTMTAMEVMAMKRKSLPWYQRQRSFLTSTLSSSSLPPKPKTIEGLASPDTSTSW